MKSSGHLAGDGFGGGRGGGGGGGGNGNPQKTNGPHHLVVGPVSALRLQASPFAPPCVHELDHSMVWHSGLSRHCLAQSSIDSARLIWPQFGLRPQPSASAHAGYWIHPSGHGGFPESAAASISSKPISGDDGGGEAAGGGDAGTSRAPLKKKAFPFSCARASSLGSKYARPAMRVTFTAPVPLKWKVIERAFCHGASRRAQSTHWAALSLC